MDERYAQVGWTEAQWNRVREEVLRAWQGVRVAGSFLSVYGPLPPSTQVVPSEVINRDGTVDDQGTADLLEIALPVRLTRQQVLEEDLDSALLQFRRRATQVGQLEDWYIFNGTYPRRGLEVGTRARSEGTGEPSRFRPDYPFLDDADSTGATPTVRGVPKQFADRAAQTQGLLRRNPGALGLIEGPMEAQEPRHGIKEQVTASSLNNQGLMNAIVEAINLLEESGYVAPYVCVFGRRPFQASYDPIGNGTVLPRDRLEPLIGRELLHASAIDVPPRDFPGYSPPSPQDWQRRGVLLSLAGDAVDLAVAAEATPEFRQVDERGRYVFSVFERFALRIKDLHAIAPLRFEDPPPVAPRTIEEPPPTPPRRRSLSVSVRRRPRPPRPRRASG
jgi:uncharacterized linocin/CFP29 family protein